MKRGARSRVMRPLRERFEMVDRFARFDLDNDLQLVAALGRHQKQIRIQRRRSAPDGGVLLVPGVYGRLVPAAKLRLKQADDAVMLELLSDRPHENRAQRAPPNRWISTRLNPEV